MYCIYCGTENPQEAKYCRNCGKAVYQKKAESSTYAYSYKRADTTQTQSGRETGKSSSDSSGTYAYAYKRAETSGTGSAGTSAQKQATPSAAQTKPKAPATAQPKKKRGFFATIGRAVLLIAVISLAFTALILVGEKIDEKNAREWQERWEATRPTRDPVEIAQEQRLPGVYKDYWDLPIFANRGMGSCKALTGDVALTVLFMDDTGSGWTEQKMDEFTGQLYTDIAELTNEAAQWGVELNITVNTRQAVLDYNVTPSTAWSSSGHYFAKAGYDSYDILSLLQAELGTKSVPVIVAFNKAGRSYAVQDSNERNAEICYIFDDPSAIKHELLHLFGAADFYYHDQLDFYVNEFLLNSVMSSSGGKKVDDLTAYLVGWTDDLTSGASIAATAAGVIGKEELLQAKSDNQFTGYGTREYDDGSIYNGMLEVGVPHGWGEMQLASGDKYYGNFDHGYRSGYGVYHWADGTVYEGYFREGLLDGEGKITYPNGQVKTGTWKNGTFIG